VVTLSGTKAYEWLYKEFPLSKNLKNSVKGIKMTSCPKYLIININDGLFTFKASLLADWIASSNKGGEFIELFTAWINGRDDSNTTPYTLGNQSIHKAGLEHFMDTVIEKKHSSVKCQQCGSEHNVGELVYQQYGVGTWIKRKLTCTCDAVLYDIGMLSFQLRDGAKLPDGVNRIL
jgi:hypothetical protein